MAQATKLASSRWWRLMPIIFITYSFAYVDRSNFGFGAAGGMTESLHITSGITSLIGALFFLGYFFFQIPGANYAEKKSAKKLLFWSMVLWGILAAATGVVTSVPLLLIDRFLLGIVESAVFPALLILISNWFGKRERSRANTILILGNPATVLWMSIASGYLVQFFGWQWMFIIEGLVAIVWGGIWWLTVKDNPQHASWLTEQEKRDIAHVLQMEQTELQPVPNLWVAAKSGNVLSLIGVYFFWSIGIYGFIMWLPSILKQMSHEGIAATGWLSALPYLLAIFAMIGISYVSDKTLRRKAAVWPCLMLGGVLLYVSYQIGTQHFLVSYILLVIAGAALYAPYGPFFAVITEILPRNVAGGAMALVNSMGALGSFIGTYVVGLLNGSTGSPQASFLLMAIAMLLSGGLMLFVRKGRHRNGSGSEDVDEGIFA
ncbi:MFS transporter [Alicyclobacillus suci]|uniref:MFS transporter n=1 Tax=Alicyclobacillus suci TaxID=2816080 RepID=UPI001A9039D4|nr:MFS transporter [Alicyclobacillus suci]